MTREEAWGKLASTKLGVWGIITVALMGWAWVVIDIFSARLDYLHDQTLAITIGWLSISAVYMATRAWERRAQIQAGQIPPPEPNGDDQDTPSTPPA